MVNKNWVVLGVVGVLASSAGAASAVLVAGRGAETQPVSQVHRFDAHGPSAEYSGDFGAVSVDRPMRFTTPSGARSYQAVVELSYDARTHGPGPFRVGLRFREASGRAVPTRPGHPVMVDPDSVAPDTARFLVRDLEPATTYLVDPTANSTSPPQGRNVIRLRGLLVTADLTPVG